MPTITLSDAVDAKLKNLVTEPFEQTRESIIESLINAELDRRGVSVNGNHSSRLAMADVIRLDPDSYGSLVHTKVLSASVDGREIHRPKWNGLREHLHTLALKRLGSFDALKKASGARLRPGRFEKDGFKYLPQGDFSIQGVDASSSWDHALRIARTMSVPIKVTLEWRDKEGATHPGRRGLLEWTPAKS
jgi:hypothetical protein